MLVSSLESGHLRGCDVGLCIDPLEDDVFPLKALLPKPGCPGFRFLGPVHQFGDFALSRAICQLHTICTNLFEM